MLNRRFARDTLSLSNRIDAISAPPSHYLGESFGGGIIVYLESDKQHGIIAATQDGDLGNGGNTGSDLGGDLALGNGGDLGDALGNGGFIFAGLKAIGLILDGLDIKVSIFC
jgi:hypothetical protein